MIVVRHEDGSFSFTMTAAEVDALTYEIACTDSAWGDEDSDYFRKTYADPADMPLSSLHKAIHAEHRAAGVY